MQELARWPLTTSNQAVAAISHTFPGVTDPLRFFGDDESEAKALYANVTASDLATVLAGNIAMNEPARYLARVMAEHGENVWLDRFDYVPVAQRATEHGAPHSSDLPFIFDTERLRSTNPQDDAMAQTLNAYVANFALHGDPNGPDLPEWNAFSAGDEMLMHFTSERGAVFERDPLAARLNLIERVRERSRIVYRGALPSSKFIFNCKTS
jgi:para-nitrobenzyl esterase